MFINETLKINGWVTVLAQHNMRDLAHAQEVEDNAEKWQEEKEERIAEKTQKIIDSLGEKYAQCPICDNPYSSMTKCSSLQTHYPETSAYLRCEFCKHQEYISFPIPVKKWSVYYTTTINSTSMTVSEHELLAESPEHAESLLRRFFGFDASDEGLQIHEIVEVE